MIKKIILIGLLLAFAACTQQQNITSFDECVSAGNSVMESYPRQCSANGQTFVEELEIPQDAIVCPDPRPTAATREYLPVLGSDGLEYNNWRIACMNEQVQWYQAVNINEPEPPSVPDFTVCTDEEKAASMCTMDYRPVCGLVDNGVRCVTTPCPSTDAITYGNACGACSSQALGHYAGACEEQLFVVCNGVEVKTGFSPEKFAQDTGGICVDICPGNYDMYMTQIGVELCIAHYGVEEINTWESCEKSSNTCNCVRTTETTRGEEIQDAGYKCVPDQYAERLLFRSGQDRLDENGEQSVAIA